MVAVGVVDLLHPVEVHHQHAEHVHRAAVDRVHRALELRVEAALHPQTGEVVVVEKPLHLLGEALPQGIVHLVLEHRLAEHHPIARLQERVVHLGLVHHGAVGAAEVDQRPVAVAAVLDPQVTPGDAVVAQREPRLGIAPHLERLEQLRAHAHVRSHEDHQRRRDPLAQLPLERVAQGDAVDAPTQRNRLDALSSRGSLVFGHRRRRYHGVLRKEVRWIGIDSWWWAPASTT